MSPEWNATFTLRNAEDERTFNVSASGLAECNYLETEKNVAKCYIIKGVVIPVSSSESTLVSITYRTAEGSQEASLWIAYVSNARP